MKNPSTGIDENTGTIVWQPNINQQGFNRVIIKVNDRRGGVTL